MDFLRIFDILEYQQARYPQKAALSYKDEAGKWQSYSIGQCIDFTNRVSAALLRLGLQRGDKAALYFHAGNPFWNFLDFGMQQIGVIPVPLHANAPCTEIRFTFNDAAIQYAFVSHADQFERIGEVRQSCPELKEVYAVTPIPGTIAWETLLAAPSDEEMETIIRLRASIREDDMATLIYTSGTTGQPKGVMLSHKNIVSNIKGGLILIPLHRGQRTVSFLPLSHVFERMVIYAYIAAGASVYYGHPAWLSELLKEVRPHYFTSVPRYLEKVYDLIINRAQRFDRFRRFVLLWAVALGERYSAQKLLDPLYLLQLELARILVFWRWKRALGGQIRGVIVGAAALQPRLGALFSAAGISIREGYGLTETSPVIAINRFEPGGNQFGTVGIPVPGVELQIENPDEHGEGEILVRGPNIMMGYYKQPELTASVLSPDGWFRTGDVGKIVHKRFLKITDRKKDIFKTTHGKYVAPQVLENHLLHSPYIGQCIVVGANRPYIVALIVPSWEQLRIWCEENKVHWTAPQYMILNPKVVKWMETVIDECNEPLPNLEKIRRFALLHEEWTVENGALAHTLKLRRNVLEEKYSKEISQLYTD